MRVIITGGSGLIGRVLTNDLIKDGHEVIVLSRNPDTRYGNVLPGVRVEPWDGKTAEGWGRLADGAGAIVNLAGENLSSGRWTQARKKRIRMSRIDAGNAIVQAVEKAKQRPGVVIQSSAVGYYGPLGDELVTEEDPPGDDFLARLCIEWEAATEGVESLGVRRAITRSGVVLSPEAGALPRMALPFRFFVGGHLGSGKQWLAWIHIADEVAGIRFLIDHPTASGPYNLTSPNPVTNKDFIRALGRALLRPAFTVAPAFALKLAFGEMSTVVLDGQRVLPKRLLEAGFQFKFPYVDEALRNLYRSTQTQTHTAVR